MKVKTASIVVISAMALMAFAASSAAATTFEVGGVPRNEAIKFKATLAFGHSMLLSDTSGGAVDTCTQSTMEGHTEGLFSNGALSGRIDSLSLTSCSEGDPITDSTGTFTVENRVGTTNGTLRSSALWMTVPSFFGLLTCETRLGTDLGTITGVSSGSGSMDINAVIECSPIGSAKWSGTYTTTSPGGLGVSP